MLRELQRGLEVLYRLEPSPDVRAFVLDDAARRQLGAARTPREQLLLVQGQDGLEMGLFVDPATLENLARNDPRRGVSEQNLGDLCLAVEGVSHFLFLAYRARVDLPVSGLELELQAEIDKYVTCLLLGGTGSPELRTWLFEKVRYHSDLSAEEGARYTAANDHAARYAHSLEKRFVGPGRIPAMLDELRRFYRKGLSDKLATINVSPGHSHQPSG